LESGKEYIGPVLAHLVLSRGGPGGPMSLHTTIDAQHLAVDFWYPKVVYNLA
jgi:hypothetical protein